MQIIIISMIGISVMTFSYFVVKNKDRINSRDKDAAFRQNCRSYHLSDRETEVARLILQGHTYKGVADRLFISEKTVDSHIQNIYGKTGVRNKLSLYDLMYGRSRHGDCP